MMPPRPYLYNLYQNHTTTYKWRKQKWVVDGTLTLLARHNPILKSKALSLGSLLPFPR